jgi:two-component system, sensor histidine kinase and response regulator
VQMPPEASILVVDDQSANLSLLFHALEQAGYSVRVVTSGEMALASVARALPDLILLDVMMPGLDGFETCRRLKADPLTAEVPVIFLTALADAVNELAGLQFGAVDYLTKPIQLEIALARIDTHLTLRRLQRRLQQQNQELDAYARSVAHDLKSPLTAVLGAAQLLATAGEDAPPELIRTYASIVLRAGRQANSTIDALLLLAGVRRGSVTPRPLAMAEIVAEAREQVAPLLAERGGSIRLPDRWPAACGHAPWVVQIWTNYLSNGLKYSAQPPALVLGATPQPNGMLQFWVQDHGPGLGPEARARLFTEGTRLQPDQAPGNGLGLWIVRRIAERLGGSAGVESEPGRGCRFFFTLPPAV